MISLLGWMGSIIYLVGHAYISIVKEWEKGRYYSGNFVAATLLLVSSTAKGSTQAAIINSFWALISVLLLLGIDVAKLPLARRSFYTGLSFLILVIVYTAFTSGVTSTPTIDALAWSSSYVFCLGYLLFCGKKISSSNYFQLNIYAAFVLLPRLWLDQNWPVFTLELCWVMISLVGLIKRSHTAHLID